MRLVVSIVVVGLLAGCNRSSNRGGDTVDVYEAIFRHSLKAYPADAVAYLAVDSGDVPADVLARLRDDKPNLQPASAEPKAKGLRVYADGLRWLDRDTAEVSTGYWFPTEHSGEGRFADYQVVRQSGRWVMKRVGNETVS